jgi:hypothetical protein
MTIVRQRAVVWDQKLRYMHALVLADRRCSVVFLCVLTFSFASLAVLLLEFNAFR